MRENILVIILMILAVAVAAPTATAQLNNNTTAPNVNVSAPDMPEVGNETKKTIEETRKKKGETIAGEEENKSDYAGYFTSQSTQFFTDDRLIQRGTNLIVQGDTLIIVDGKATKIHYGGERVRKIANETYILKFSEERRENLTIFGVKTFTVTRQIKTFNQSSSKYETTTIREQEKREIPIGRYNLKTQYANGANTPDGWISHQDWQNIDWWGDQGKQMYSNMVGWYSGELNYNPPTEEEIEQGTQLKSPKKYKERAQELISDTVHDARMGLTYYKPELLMQHLKGTFMEYLTTWGLGLIPGLAPPINFAIYATIGLLLIWKRKEIAYLIKGDRRVGDFIKAKIGYWKLTKELERKQVSEGDWEELLRTEIGLNKDYAGLLTCEESPFRTPYLTSTMLKNYMLYLGKDDKDREKYELDEKKFKDFDELKIISREMRNTPVNDEIIAKIFELACKYRMNHADNTSEKKEWERWKQVCRNKANELASQKEQTIEEKISFPETTRKGGTYRRDFTKYFPGIREGDATDTRGGDANA